MSTQQARVLAQTAQGQAVAAVNIIQRSPNAKTDADKYDENLALAVANLSQAFVEFLKTQ